MVYMSGLLYEALILAQLVKQPNHLLRGLNGTVMKKDGQPLYDNNPVARRLDADEIAHLLPLRS
jgi:hypothetical protein